MVLSGLLAIGLLVVSYARLAGDVNSPAFNIQIVQTALGDPLWHTRLGLNIFLFSCAMLALHLAFGATCWLLALLSEKALPLVRCSRRQWVLIWFIVGALWTLIANANFFPQSSLGEPYQDLIHASLFGITPWIAATTALLGIIALMAIQVLRRYATRRLVWPAAGVAALLTAGGFVSGAPAHRPAEPGVPNIIILGIDSLRPDAVTADAAPHIRGFLDGATEFTDAVTPLARTFPSWVSILTGRHPHTTGAYMNLLSPQLIHVGNTLPQLLHERGYRTYYAIDETRFSNIDASYGFDQTATPTIGGSDFVLAWFADTPLSNLIMNSRLGAVLFPHVHANRAAHVTYDPDSFVQRVGRVFDFSQPFFLATHLTLPHWPFTWATSPESAPNADNTAQMYQEAVHRADRQFGDLLEILRRRGALDNALVIVLSDHGEALGRDDDLISGAFPDSDDHAANAQKWGHGTSVFSPHQYHVVLGMRAYGPSSVNFAPPGHRNAPVSLLDLAPTILEFLHVDPDESCDGQSLLPLIQSGMDSEASFISRIRFTESEYNPQGFISPEMTPSAIANAARVYRLDPVTDRILVRSELIDQIMSSRQYAAMLGDSFAGAVPSSASGGPYRFVYAPGNPGGDPKEETRLRQALEKRFGVRFEGEPTEIKPQQ